MLIQTTAVDRYLYESYLNGSAEAQSWLREARRKADWLTDELVADVFFSFYAQRPEIGPGSGSTPLFHVWFVKSLRKQFLYNLIRPRTVNDVPASFRASLKALLWLASSFADQQSRGKLKLQAAPASTPGLQPKGGASEASAAGKGSSAGSEGPQQPAKGASAREEGPMTMEMVLAYERAAASPRSVKPSGGSVAEQLAPEQLERLKRIGAKPQQLAGQAAAAEQEAPPATPEQLAQQKRDIAALEEELRKPYQPKRDKLKQRLKQLEARLKEEERHASRLRRDEEALAEQFERQFGSWLHEALKEALQEQNEEGLRLEELIMASRQLASPTWGRELGKLRRLAYDRYADWIEKLKRHPELLEFLREVGRHTGRIRKRLREQAVSRRPDTFDDYARSRELSLMLPSEALLLADEEYELLFYRSYLEGQLLTWRAQSAEDRTGEGPVIAMLDTSHSMKGAKLRLAQLFTATLASLCLQKRRSFSLIVFGSKGELLERSLDHRRPDWQQFYLLSQLAFGGGTDFDAPIRRGLELVRSNPALRNADFIILTDGIGGLSKPLQQQLAHTAEERSLRLHTLLIGDPSLHRSTTFELLGASHRIYATEALDPDQTGADQFLTQLFSPFTQQKTTASHPR